MLIQATWLQYGYFVCSFQDKTIFVTHPTGKRYWIQYISNNGQVESYYGQTAFIPRVWKSYLLPAIHLRNQQAQHLVIISERERKLTKFVDLEKISDNLTWPSTKQTQFLWQFDQGTVVLSINLQVAFVLSQNGKLVRIFITRQFIESGVISASIEPSLTSLLLQNNTAEDSHSEDGLLLQTYPTQQCPSLWKKPLLLALHLSDTVSQSVTSLEGDLKVLTVASHPPFSIDSVVSAVTEQGNYVLREELIPLAQYERKHMFWYLSQSDIIMASDSSCTTLMELTHSGRIIVCHFSKLGAKTQAVYSVQGIPPSMKNRLGPSLERALAFREVAKQAVISSKQHSFSVHAAEATDNSPVYREQYCQVENIGTFWLDNEGYLHCQFQDRTFILFHPKKPRTVIISKYGTEYRLLWHSSVLFRKLIIKALQIWEWLVLDAEERRRIQLELRQLQQSISMEVRKIIREKMFIQQTLRQVSTRLSSSSHRNL